MDDRQTAQKPSNPVCILPFQFYFLLFIEPYLIAVLLKRVAGSSPKLYIAGVT